MKLMWQPASGRAGGVTQGQGGFTMHVRTMSTIAVLLAATMASAESTRGTASGEVGGKKVTINYGRPALKGRALNDMLQKLPADRVWRAGDDQVTILNTETDLMIAGKRIPAGKYSVYVHVPASGARELILNTNQGIALGKIYSKAPANLVNEPWPYLDDYQKNIGKSEVLRAPMHKDIVKTPVDVFTIDLTPSKTGLNLNFAWGDESWSIDLTAAK
jgi:hypothetical protein